MPFTLRHEHAGTYTFGFSEVRSAWFYRIEFTEPAEQRDSWENTNAASARQEEDVRSEKGGEEEEDTCMIATLLFDPTNRSEYSLNGLEGLTFFDNGTFNYRNETFGRYQEIEFVDVLGTVDGQDVATRITRERGRGRMLRIYHPAQRRTHCFTYHSTCSHPFSKRWYRWSHRPLPRFRD